LLFIDYADLQVGGELFEDVNTLQADGINWRLQGFAQNPWQGAHQFERTIIDRPVPPDSGFSVTYRFAVSENLSGDRRSGLKAGIERPWLYGIELNGRPIDQAEAEPWFDEHMRALPIGPLVHPGENALTLTAEPFHMLCEIMPVYLFGDFALRPISHGFEVAAPAPLRLGDWTSQGLPFYPDAVRYSFAFRLVESRASLSLALGSWAGSVATARIDSADPVVIYPRTDRVSLPGPFAAGDHGLAVDVYGNMRNMMGPHHAEGLPGPWTWIQCPEHMPPGGNYMLQPSGLHGIPRIEVL
jgi:hypothetical protein